MDSEWPNCSSKVLVVSPEYGDSDFRCDVIAEVTKLALWTKQHLAHASGGGRDREARLFLPTWLDNADLNDDSISAIPTSCKQIFKPYTLDLIQADIAKLFCPDCNTIDDSPQLLEHDGPVRPYEANWISEWRCSKGHLLHYAEHHWIIN